MKTPFSVTLNLNNESGVCAGATSWPFHSSMEAANHNVSFHLTDVTPTTPPWPRNSPQWQLFTTKSLTCRSLLWYFAHWCGILLTALHKKPILITRPTSYFLMIHRANRQKKKKRFLIQPFTFLFSFCSGIKPFLLFSHTIFLNCLHPLVCTSVSLRLHPSPPTSHSSHLLSVWHQRVGTLEGVVVWRGQLTPPTPLQSMCITVKHNGEPCEYHQYVARRDVVTLQPLDL